MIWFKLDIIVDNKIYRTYYICARDVYIADEMASDIAAYDRYQLTRINREEIPDWYFNSKNVLG